MPGSETTYLRIFCICGQKMRVSATMFGAPGKCIACRQKIRIPRPDELPPDTKEIYLKDHPEFLRKPPKRAEKQSSSDKLKQLKAEYSEEREETTIGEEKDRVSTVPLDVLEPLVVLASLQHKHEVRLAEIRRRIKGGEPGLNSEKTHYKAQLAKVRDARMDLDDTLRQRLMEVAIELANTQERISEASLSARVGDRDYANFRETIDRLRRRRDRLERKQANIRGWLAVRDVYMAGGYREVAMESLPVEFATLTLPSEPDFPGPLVDWYLESLRAGFQRREQAERRLAEAKQMRKDGTVPKEGADDLLAECAAEKSRADASIAFFRGRLQQLDADYQSELKAVDAQMEMARSSLQSGKANAAQFEDAEQTLLQAKADIGKARMMIQRGLSAPGARDVPRIKGTFLGRLAQPREQGLAADVVVGWAGGFLMLIALALPAIGGLSPMAAVTQLGNEFPFIKWYLIGPLIGAIPATISAFISNRKARTSLMTISTVLLSVAATLLLRTTFESGGSLGQLVQSASPYQLGLLAFGLGLVAFSVSSFMATAPHPEFRIIPFGGVIAVILCAGGVYTDFGGTVRPQPFIDVSFAPDSTRGPGMYVVSVTVGNSGWRRMVLDTNSKVPNTFTYSLEEKIGEKSWRPTATPETYDFQDGTRPMTRPSLPGVVITRPAPLTLKYALPAGTYRASLRALNSSREVSETFLVGGGDTTGTSTGIGSIGQKSQSTATPGDLVPSDSDVPSTPTASTPNTALPERVEVELKGTIGSDTMAPRFSVYVHRFNGKVDKYNLGLRDIIWGEWAVLEHNSQLDTLTIGDGNEILILRRGERVAIDAQPEELPKTEPMPIPPPPPPPSESGRAFPPPSR